MGSANEMSLQSCQASFQWERWNCPSTDFFRRLSTKSSALDREDAYVSAISMAAVLYTITKQCSSGTIAGCGCCSNANSMTPCSDDPQKAEELYKSHVNTVYGNDFNGQLMRHNSMAISNLLRKSLTKKCVCLNMGPNGCLNEVCLNVLKSFAEIAADIRQMYEEGLQLSNTVGLNAQVMWRNVPLDVLVFSQDSPSFCEPDALPLWNGMRGRQCSAADGDNISPEERVSCHNLCRECGYQVRTRKVVTEKPCNCQLSWGFQVQCDTCVNVEEQYYCY